MFVGIIIGNNSTIGGGKSNIIDGNPLDPLGSIRSESSNIGGGNTRGGGNQRGGGGPRGGARGGSREDNRRGRR